MKTAVEWLFERLRNTDKDKFTWYAILKQAKEMDRQQIIDAHLDGQSLVSCKDEYAEQYYQETFKSE
jgi:hypothetical protein